MGSILIALPVAGLAAAIKYADKEVAEDFLVEVMPDSSVYQSFAFLTTFLLVFRTIQAYQRFQIGSNIVGDMIGMFHESAVVMLSFSRAADAKPPARNEFRSM